MNPLFDVLMRGARFVRNNPQMTYTLFLVIVIPVAFFYTSEQFLRVASDNQDRLERNRVGLMENVFVLFAREKMGSPELLRPFIEEVASQNETMSTLTVLGKGPKGELPILASLENETVGQLFVTDPGTQFLIGSAAGTPDQAFASEYYVSGVRYWRSVRAIQATSSEQVAGFVLVDLSMAEADDVARKNIENAYIVLSGMILLIIVLLARQARIVDYALLYKKLEQVDKMKDDFVSMAAHELRSPLTVIRGYVDMIGEGEGLSDASKQHLHHIDVSAQQLNMLIGDILDVSKLQEGRMSFTFKLLDISESLSDIVESFIKPAEDKGLKLFYAKQSLPKISVDPERFRQVIVNLVGNAIKYTPKGEVRVMTYTEGSKVTIRVSDTGLGMSREEQEKLFQKFYRVKNKETDHITGTGLGLWISAQIVKSMKGTITVESIKWKGTDVIVSFPIETVEPAIQK